MTKFSTLKHTLAALILDARSDEGLDHTEIAALRDAHEVDPHGAYAQAYEEAHAMLTGPEAITRAAMAEALHEATVWSEHGYTDKSRYYWRGMRDTLRVVLGITTTTPSCTGLDSDSAAFSLLGAQERITRR